MSFKAINNFVRPNRLILIVGGRTLARRKPYKNDTRKPSNKATNKRVCKYKAITKEEN